jgi:hypothetical protein
MAEATGSSHPDATGTEVVIDAFVTLAAA